MQKMPTQLLVGHGQREVCAAGILICHSCCRRIYGPTAVPAPGNAAQQSGCYAIGGRDKLKPECIGLTINKVFIVPLQRWSGNLTATPPGRHAAMNGYIICNNGYDAGRKVNVRQREKSAANASVGCRIWPRWPRTSGGTFEQTHTHTHTHTDSRTGQLTHIHTNHPVTCATIHTSHVTSTHMHSTPLLCHVHTNIHTSHAAVGHSQTKWRLQLPVKPCMDKGEPRVAKRH